MKGFNHRQQRLHPLWPALVSPFREAKSNVRIQTAHLLADEGLKKPFRSSPGTGTLWVERAIGANIAKRKGMNEVVGYTSNTGRTGWRFRRYATVSGGGETTKTIACLRGGSTTLGFETSRKPQKKDDPSLEDKFFVISTGDIGASNLVDCRYRPVPVYQECVQRSALHRRRADLVIEISSDRTRPFNQPSAGAGIILANASRGAAHVATEQDDLND